MAKQDYGQKRRSGSSASRKPARQSAPRRAPPPRRLPLGLTLVTLAVVTGLAYLLYFLLNTPPDATAPATEPTAKAVQPAPVKPAVKTEPIPVVEPKESRFEFYEKLPKAEIVAPKVEAYKSTPKDAIMEHRYMLQAGSFRDPADAERMRARLILEGLPGVRTDRSEGSNGTWYRVRIGPFDNRTAMNQASNRLGKLRIIPMEVRID
ncbi:SPOR domain-containing protein [Marinobacterium sp. MBR-109]|jgi:cell division protein FtsN|uniref:SPOR domain-containing protein n=1 Tax=Marinobacterium sp. MBR-109 TaxID=3156462 RepID=UPI00339102AA